MSKLPLYSSDEIINALVRGGFEIARKSKSGHLSLRRPKQQGEGTDVTVVPMNKKEVPRGTFRSILRLANVEVDEFLEWL
ncbi:MAG: type II toxin-antitoxin system HicA family toxin [Anaerolineae bacterium]